MWMTRAKKILMTLEHVEDVLTWIEESCEMCNRMLNVYKVRLLKNETEETLFSAS